MRRVAIAVLAAVACCSWNGDRTRAEELPDDAARLVAAFEEDAEALRAEAEAKIAKQRQELAAKLKVLQDQYCRAAKLDEAVAIRDKIRLLVGGGGPAQADPGSLQGFGGRTGTRHHFRVTGKLGGSVFGTDVYTTDSTLATAAVHAGAVKVGETAVVRVTILPGRANYLSSTRNGVSSYEWSDYPSSYSVERVRESAPVDEGKSDASRSSAGNASSFSVRRSDGLEPQDHFHRLPLRQFVERNRSTNPTLSGS